MSDSISIPLKVGFLGAGQMATALAKGWQNAGLVSAGTLRASDPYAEARNRFHQQTGAVVTADNLEVVKKLDGIVDIYLPDFKYTDGKMAAKYSNGASDYPEVAAAVIKEIAR